MVLAEMRRGREVMVSVQARVLLVDPAKLPDGALRKHAMLQNEANNEPKLLTPTEVEALLAEAKRYPAPALSRAIAHAADIDRAIKGVGLGQDPWEEFAKLGLELHAAGRTA